MALLLAFYLILSAVIPASALEGSQTTAALVIKADVLYWEEGELIVKEFSGHEERLKVTPETKIEGVVGGRLKTGDKIVAQITDDRRALVITLQVPDAR
jgi:multidrug efflux pump subunit AcrA (membrane-fusion protein)